jgi:hypothetical protein
MWRRRGAVESRHASIEELRETTRFLLDLLDDTDDIYDEIQDEATQRMIAEDME